MYRSFIKPGFDFCFAFLILCITLPLLFILGFLLFLQNSGTPLFSQVRPGLKEKPFTIYKLKTMQDTRDDQGVLLPTIVEFKKQKNYLLKGKVYQEKPIIKYDKDFGIDVAYYQNKTNFYQKIRPISDSFKIQGNINYMACDDNQCLALEKIFNLQVNRQD